MMSPRLLPLALSALALLGACRPAADADVVDSPSSSVAGLEARPDSSAPRKPHASPTPKSGLATTLVAVASVDASDAQPCERICGDLGDCLHTDDDRSASIAGGLELECLDMCVHSPDGNPAKTEFLACAGKTECSELVGCAERSWTALADAREGPTVAGIVASSDPCKSGCRWFYSCFHAGQPPDSAYVDSYTQSQMDDCVNACDEFPPQQRELMTWFASCLPDHCAPELAGECWEAPSY